MTAWSSKVNPTGREEVLQLSAEQRPHPAGGQEEVGGRIPLPFLSLSLDMWLITHLVQLSNCVHWHNKRGKFKRGRIRDT